MCAWPYAVAVFTALRALRYAGADAAAARTAASAIFAGAISADLAAANTQVAKHAAAVKVRPRISCSPRHVTPFNSTTQGLKHMEDDSPRRYKQISLATSCGAIQV